MRRLWLGLGFSAAIAAGQDFVRDVKPVLEANCLACHNAQRNYAGVRLESAALAAKAIVAGAPEKSSLWMTMEIAPGKIKAMPPGGPQLPQARVCPGVHSPWVGQASHAQALEHRCVPQPPHDRVCPAAHSPSPAQSVQAQASVHTCDPQRPQLRA